jgi:Nitronate monooxygenase
MPVIETALTRLLAIEHPIMLAPMGSAAGGKLASAVTNAGGLGMIGSGQADITTIRTELSEGGNARVGIKWKSTALRAYQRRIKQADSLIAGAYLAGTNTRRVRRALSAVFGGAVSKDTEEHDRGGLPVEPDPHHGAVEDHADDRFLGQRAGIPGVRAPGGAADERRDNEHRGEPPRQVH